MSKLPTQAELTLAALTDTLVSGRKPAAAWAALHLARTHNLPVPDAVTVEIDRVAAEIGGPLLAAWNGDARATLGTKDILGVFGIKRGDPLTTQLRVSNRNTSILADYVTSMRENMSDGTAVTTIAKRHGVGEKLVREILADFRKNVGPTDPWFFTEHPTDTDGWVPD